jgi:hypothetical protein
VAFVQAQSFRARDRLTICQRHRHVDGIAKRLRPGQIAARHLRRRKVPLGCWPVRARMFAPSFMICAPGARRTAPPRPGRRAGPHPGDLGRLSALGPPARPAPSHAQPRHRGLVRSVAEVRGAHCPSVPMGHALARYDALTECPRASNSVLVCHGVVLGIASCRGNDDLSVGTIDIAVCGRAVELSYWSNYEFK